MQYHYFLISLRIRLQLRTYCWLVITWSSCLPGDLELRHCTPTHLGKTELIFKALSFKVLSYYFELERNFKGLKTISQFFNKAKTVLLSGNNKHYRRRLNDLAKGSTQHSSWNEHNVYFWLSDKFSFVRISIISAFSSKRH